MRFGLAFFTLLLLSACAQKAEENGVPSSKTGNAPLAASSNDSKATGSGSTTSLNGGQNALGRLTSFKSQTQKTLSQDEPQTARLNVGSIDDGPVNDDHNQFLNKSGVEIALILGVPAQVRRDGPAEVWQYRRQEGGVTCLLDIFLYGATDISAKESRSADAVDENLSAGFVDLRGVGATADQRRACFASMIRAARPIG